MKFSLGMRRNNKALSFPELCALKEARSSSRAGGGVPPDHAFFEEAEFQGLLGNDLLEIA
jgi:hypothetical protein